MARRRKRVDGECHICERHGRLSYEHVPPEAAFNDRAVTLLRGERALREFRREKPSGLIQQRGCGEYTLCERCNSRTGAWYGTALASWCRQGAALLEATKGQPTLAYPYYIYPLRVLKEIAAMFFSVNAVAFRNGPTSEIRRSGPELAQFVLNRQRRRTPPPFRFFAYSTGLAGAGRFAGWATMVHDGRTDHLSEIALPPLGYVMTAGNDAPHGDMEELTAFGDHEYDDFKMVHLRLPVLSVATPYPGDYRTPEDVMASEETIAEGRTVDGQPTPLRAVRISGSS